ncbi:CocE/NonD family hydrolase [Nannocystis sp. ILAH1]|uniref:CocE/NonD family hydrolase n=1 Tax=unclassified Nannocystis TaxID=2627009 RepID=UPI0022720123|nr:MULTISPECIES: CocE/NonD family hydrolase [unclassified Nannocystis]MCY0989176.1 CocE/NonD family hydrolase [Nannocystis sp. ILAH1]MCY1067890.1 CocE/NonD family hydrolase [Nannocystis sp. RBIL2]
MKRVLKIVGLVLGVLVALVAIAAGVLIAMQPERPPARVIRPQVVMRDGVPLAVDVILPEPMPAERVPVVLFQTRYWRSFATIFPDQPGVPPIGPRDASVDALVAAGYGVVVADVRGTGASGGTWPRPWSGDEVADASELIAWIAAQPFCDGRVGAAGVSYEGTTALLSATTTNPALRAVLAREVEWDLLDELLAPGGVRNTSFIAAWGEDVASLDKNRVAAFFPAPAKYIVTGVHPVDGDEDGVALAELVEARRVADVAGAVVDVRGPTDLFAGVPVTEVGPAAHANRLAQTKAAVGLWGGFWDAATADAVLRADQSMPLAEAVIGPWTHEGDASASPFGPREGAAVDLAEVVAFFDRHLKGTAPPAPKRRYWVAGAEVWRVADAWPATRPTTYSLASGGQLVRGEASLDARLDVDFAATTGTMNRWVTGLLRPVDTGDRAKARGLLSFDHAPLTETLSVFGAPVLRCQVTADGDDSALFAYLEARLADGPTSLLTEGVARLRGGAVEVRLRPIAFELPAGSSLRVSLAGADADTFERVPAEGPRSLAFSAPCTLELPVAVQ